MSPSISKSLEPVPGKTELSSLDSLLMPPPPRRLAAIPPTGTIGTTKEADDPKRTPSSYNIVEQKSAIVDQQGPKEQQQHGTASPSFVTAEPTTVKFRDIIGHKDAKLRLEEALLSLALQTLPPQVLAGIRGGSLSGILLHGPPGTGKTMLAHALAGEVGASFLSVSPADILSKYVGESEKSIQHLFMVAKHEARQNRHGCILFLDEIDALGQSRCSHNTSFCTPVNTNNPSGTRVLAELLIQISNLSKEQQQHHPSQRMKQQKHERSQDVTEKCEKYQRLPTSLLTLRQLNTEVENTISSPTAVSDGVATGGRVILIAATNRPADCDPALLRRFTVRVFIDLPSERDRCRMIQRFLRDIHHILTKSDIQQISNATYGFSGSDLESFSREAIMAPIRDCLKGAASLKRKARREYHRLSSQHTMNKKSRLQRKASARNDQDGGPSLTVENTDGTTSASTIRLEVVDSVTAETVKNYQIPTSSKMNPNDIAREHLLLGLQNLRPVTLKDFKNAYSFWLGGGENDRSATIAANSSIFSEDKKERFPASSVTNETFKAMEGTSCTGRDNGCCNTTILSSSEDDDLSSYSTLE